MNIKVMQTHTHIPLRPIYAQNILNESKPIFDNNLISDETQNA